MLALLAAVVPGAPKASGALSVSPAAIHTGLRWDNVSGGKYPYAGTRLEASGNQGVLTWSVEDQNGTVLAVLSAPGGKTAAGIFGQIDCSASARNSTCTYNAPAEYPPGERAALVAHDGPSRASVSVTFEFAYNLQEYWKRRARMLGFNSKPVSQLVIGTNPVRYQPELLIFQPGPAPGKLAAIEDQIVQDDNDETGAQFPVTAGSGINRPAWSYDGKWFSWGGNRCSPRVWCSGGDDSKWIARTDGSELQRIAPTLVPGGFAFTYSEAEPDWLLTSDASHLFVIDLGRHSSRTAVASYAAPAPRSLCSQANGSTGLFKEPNATACVPVSPGCSPNLYYYDFAPCLARMGADCARLISQWNLNLGLDSGWDANGQPHCSAEGGGFNCERHVHDIYLRRNSTDVVWNYGSAGEAGEALFYQASALGTGAAALFPNAGKGVPYFSHPAFDASGNRIAYEGQRQCGPNGHTCTNQVRGEGIWDLRPNRAVAFAPGASYGHGAWDGFDENHFAHDGYGGSACPPGHWCLHSSTIDYRAGTIADATAIDFGVRDQNALEDHSFGLLFGPVQSPDGTKIAESMRTSFSAANQWVGWISVVRSPDPPAQLTLASDAADSLGWPAPELSREAQAFMVYKQPGCAGLWTVAARVPAHYHSRGPYTFTDARLADGQTACYGVSTEEWSGLESSTFSPVLRVTSSQGRFTAEPAAAPAHLELPAPQPPSGFAAARVPLPAPAGAAQLSQGGGGTLADGTYWVRVSYCNFADFPANSEGESRCTPPGPAASLRISDGNGRASLQVATPADEMDGQVAVRIYASGPSPAESRETAQTCSGPQASGVLLWPPSGWPGQFSCTLKGIAPGQAAATADQTLQGLRLTWKASPSDEVRYYAIYARDEAAPALAHADAYSAQQWLIATVPAGSSAYFDYTADWARAYRHSGGPFYGIVAVDRHGNRSAPLCLEAGATTAIPCN